MKNIRILNGYVVIYRPDHPKAMRSKNWNGYVYEHIVIAEEDLGRELFAGEEVHHLDLDRSNNRPSNLIVLSKTAHRKLHTWINNGAFISKDIDGNPVNSGKPKLRCKVCEKPLKLKQKYYCSVKCMLEAKTSKMDGISLEEVLIKLSSNSFVQVAKEYNISDNGLRKWLFIKHGFNKATLSEALSTLKERAETSGEV